MDFVYSFLNDLSIDNNQKLIVAVSYGPDSMFLLDLLKNRYKDNTIICAHVNHNLRKESINEAEDLKQYCQENNIIFEYMEIMGYKDNKFTEEEARNKRYEFFESLMLKYKSKYLFTAHHGDDLSETILMRIVRGSNINGYLGIRLISSRNNYKIIRPLLYLSKNYIEEFCISKNIPFAVDKSNYNDKYTRNRFRNNILKTIKKENENVHLKFLDFSNTLQEYDGFVNKIVDKKYKDIVAEDTLNIEKLVQEEDLIKKKIVELYLLNVYKEDIKEISDKHVKNIFELISNNKPNLVIDMPCKRKLVKSYNKIYFDNFLGYNDFCYEFNNELSLPNGYVIKQVNVLDDSSNYTTAFNSKEISLPLYVRNKIDGDKIDILGLNGAKKIKDIFIDEKVNIENRKNYPIVVDAKGNILWLPGLKKSKYDKSKQGNYDIILKYQREVYNDTTK